MQNYQVTFINLSMNLYINNVLFKKVNKIKSSQEYILYKNKHSYFNFSKNKDILFFTATISGIIESLFFHRRHY